MDDEVAMVPFAAYESLATRFSRIIKYLIIGWACSVFALGLVIVISLSYTEEVVTEETTAEVIQDANEYGSNYYAGGDMNGYADGTSNGYEDNDDAETGTGV